MTSDPPTRVEQDARWLAAARSRREPGEMADLIGLAEHAPTTDRGTGSGDAEIPAADIDAHHADVDFNKVSRELEALGYSLLSVAPSEDGLISTAVAIGNLIDARSLGVTHLRATASDVWLGRHTETLTDASVPIQYFALGCLVPAARGGETLLFDGRKAARLVAESLPGARGVRIRYRSRYRPEVADHSLIVEDDQYGPVLRFRSATENNEIIAKPIDVSEADLYATVDDAVSGSLVLSHSWRAGQLLLVNNRAMLHSRAPFAGLRHMLRFRYDDPLHPTVILTRCDT
jgi:hypothetical protein